MTSDRRELSRISKQLTDFLQELPRPGYLWPFAVTRILDRFGKIRRGRFRYSTPGQHNFVMSEIIVKKALARIIYGETGWLAKSYDREKRSIDRRLGILYGTVEVEQAEGRDTDAGILREVASLEKRKAALDFALREKRLEVQKRVLHDFMSVFEEDIRSASSISDFADYSQIFSDLREAVRANDGAKVKLAIAALSEKLVVPPELLSRRIIGHRLGDHELSLLGKFTRELDNYPEYKDAVRNLRDFGRYRKAVLLMDQLRKGKDILIPPPFVKGPKARLYEGLTRSLRLFFASMVAIIPTLTVYGFTGIRFLPAVTFAWIALCFGITYYISWQPSHKISLFIVSLIVNVPGHRMLSELGEYINANYSEEKPLKISYITAKKSDNESDAEIAIFYFRKTLDALRPTLETFGNKMLLVMTFWSDTKNDNIIEYEVKRLREFSSEYSYTNLDFLYLNRSKSEWFDNTKLGMIKVGGFAGKVGGIGNLMHFMNTGQSRPYLFTDEGFEFTQNRNKPLLCKVWSTDLKRALGIASAKDGPGITSEEAAGRIVSGDDIEIDQDRISEFCVIMDDKNELYPGELEKALAIMLHPENSHIVIAQPHIAITPPYLDGTAKESIYWKIMKNERDIENEINMKVVSGIYGKERAFFGKGFTRTKIYYERVFKPETLSPAKVLSHDWQESIFSRNCEGLLGAKRFTVKRVLDKFGAMVLRIDLADTTRFIKLEKDAAGDVWLRHFDINSGEYRLVRKFHHLKDADMDTIIRYTANFYNNSVVVGERDQLHFVTYIIRDVRWLIGDFQAIRTLISYRTILTSYHQWHLSWAIGRLLSDPMLFCFIILMCMLWIFPFILIVPTNSSAYIVTLVLSFFGIIFVHRFIDPVRYILRRSRAEGRTIRPGVFAVELIDQFFDSVLQTVETTISSLQLTVIKPLLSYSIYKSEKVNKVPEWKTSSTLSLMELEGKITKNEFKDIRIEEAQKTGIIISSIAAIYILTGIAPLTVFGIFGILPWAGSLIFGRYAIAAIGKVGDLNARSVTTRERVKKAYIIVSASLLLLIILSALRDLPSQNKHDMIKLMLPESREKFSYSADEEKLLDKMSGDLKKIEFYIPDKVIESRLAPVLKSREGKTKLLTEVLPVREKLAVAIPILKPAEKDAVPPLVREAVSPLEEPELNDLAAFRNFFAASNKMGNRRLLASTALAGAKIVLSMKFNIAGMAIMAMDRAEGLGMIARYGREYPWFNVLDPLTGQFWFETSRETGMPIKDIAEVFKWEDTKKYWNADFAKKRGIWKRYEHLQRGILSLYYSGLDVNEENLRKFFAEYDKMPQFRRKYPSIPLKPFQLVPEPVKNAFQLLGTVTFYVPVLKIIPATQIPYGTILGIVETVVAGKQGKLEYLIVTGMKNNLSTEEVMDHLGFDYANYAWSKTSVPNEVYKVNRDRFMYDYEKKGVNKVDYERSDIKLICILSDYRMALDTWLTLGNDGKPSDSQIKGIADKLRSSLVAIWEKVSSDYPGFSDGIRAKGIGEYLAVSYYVMAERYGWSIDEYMDFLKPQLDEAYELKKQGVILDEETIHEIMFNNELSQKGIFDDPRLFESEKNTAVISRIEKRIEKQSDAGKEMTGYIWLSSLTLEAKKNGIDIDPAEFASKFIQIYKAGTGSGYTEKPWWEKSGYLALIYYKAGFSGIAGLFDYFDAEFKMSDSWHKQKLELPEGFVAGVVEATYRDMGYAEDQVRLLAGQTPAKLKLDIAYEFLAKLMLEAQANGIGMQPKELASEFMMFYRTGASSEYKQIPWWNISGYFMLEYRKNAESQGWKNIDDYFRYYSPVFATINGWFLEDLPLPAGFEYENAFRLEMLKRKLDYDPRTAKDGGRVLRVIEDTVSNETPVIRKFNAYMTLARLKEDFKLDFGRELNVGDTERLAYALKDFWNELPIKYGNLPLFVPGIVEKLAINSLAFKDYRDIEKAAYLPEINALWASKIPAGIEAAIRDEVEDKTGIKISDDRVLHYTALQTGISILNGLGVRVSEPDLVKTLQLRRLIRSAAQKYPDLELLKEGNAEWMAVFALKKKLTFSEFQDKYLKQVQDIYKYARAAYFPKEIDIMAGKIKDINNSDIGVITDIYGLKDSGFAADPKTTDNDIIVNVIWYHLQRAYDIGMPVKDIGAFFRILKEVKDSNLSGLMSAGSVDQMQEWQEKMDSISFRLLSIYSDPRIRKEFRSREDIIHKFLSNSQVMRRNTTIASKLAEIRVQNRKVADSLEFLWPLLMTFEDISPSVMEDIVSKMDYVTSSYKDIIGLQPTKDSAVEFNEAVNVYLTGEYGKFVIRQKTNYQRAQSSWWTNYIIKIAYKRLFNEDLDETERMNLKLLNSMQVWFDREKLMNPRKHVLKDIVADLAANGSINRIGLFRPVYSGKDEYNARKATMIRYIKRLDDEIAALKSERRYYWDMEKISAKTKEDLAELEQAPEALLARAVEAEDLLMFFRRTHNRDSVFLTLMILSGTLIAAILSRLVFMARRAMMGLSKSTRPSEPQIPV
ncbi:MAG: hypothetical protein WC369_00025 [Dehalococcoidales bacterium]|jgi:hypothetical protein